MSKNFNAKKAVKLAGNALVILALVFIVKKIADMDIKMSDLSSPSVISAFALSTVMQAALIIIACFPWLMFTRSLSGVRISYSAAMPVYTRSNIYKYIPGNVFQYVGRNQLAADMKISHVDVACATLLDIFFCVFWTGAVSVVLLGSRIAELMRKYGRSILLVGAAGAVLLILLIAVIRLKFRDRISGYISRYAESLKKCDKKQLLSGIFYYSVHNCVSAAMYFACMALIVPEASAKELAVLTGAFMFAWIIGFVTPGAPGGIGIREGVMIFVSGEKYQDRIMLFVLTMRIASVLADISAFAVGSMYSRLRTQTGQGGN
ncbi:MAG: flippase-like domain-containing protein [Ruminococcus sp.]|nr:flippase-like domain-containing protein [Ruminococcus sp.]